MCMSFLCLTIYFTFYFLVNVFITSYKVHEVFLVLFYYCKWNIWKTSYAIMCFFLGKIIEENVIERKNKTIGRRVFKDNILKIGSNRSMTFLVLD